MNLLRTELLLFSELCKIYEKYGLILKLVPQNNDTCRHFNLIYNDTNQILLKNITKKMLLGILQDEYNGLYSRLYNELVEKINKIALSTQALKVRA